MSPKIYHNGVFDLLHVGHIEQFKKLSQLGDLYIGVHSDKDAKSYKRETIISYNDRCQMILACKYVTNVIYNTKLEITEQFIIDNNIDFVVCSKYEESYHKDPKRLGVLIVMGNARENISTTQIINKISKTNVNTTFPDSTILYKRYLTVWNRVKNINGNNIQFDVVGRSGPYPNCVCIFPFNTHDSTVTIIKEYHQGTNEWKYGLPAGYFELEKHGDVLNAAQAELSEECKLTNGTWFNLLPEGYSELKWVTNKVVPFLCINPVSDLNPKKQDVEENIILKKIHIRDLYSLIIQGKVSLTSTLTMLIAMNYLEKNTLS